MASGATRRFVHTCLFVAVVLGSQVSSAQSLAVRIEGDRLRVNAQKVRLLNGEPLRKLRDGASVTFVFRLSALSSRLGAALVKAEYRFVISYDIFEEKFQVSRTQPSPRVLSRLSLEAAEAACIEALELRIPSLAPDRPFWIRWEYEEEESPPAGESAVTLGGLVDIFSRKRAPEPVRGMVESGSLRLQYLSRGGP
jgi:hypothetical protein